MLRGYREWLARGHKPTKAEIEAIDPDWDADLDMINAIAAYLGQENRMVANVG